MDMAVRSETLAQLLGLTPKRLLIPALFYHPPCTHGGWGSLEGGEGPCWPLCWVHLTHCGARTSGRHSNSSEGEADRAGD